MKTRNAPALAAPLAAALSIGCGGTDNHQSNPSSEAIERRVTQQAAPDPPSAIVDKRGRSWVRGRAVVYAPDRLPGGQLPQRPPQSGEEEERKLAAMADEELAEKLSPRSMYAGYEYSLEKPSIEGARQFRDYLARKARGERGPEARGKGWSLGSAGGTPGKEVSEPLGSEATHANELPIVIGADNRQQASHTTFPWRTMLFITDSNWFPGSTGQHAGCTAQLVGPSFAMSVAHCFAPDDESWYSTRNWAPGVDSQATNPAPYGYWNGCYWVTIPSSYTGAGGYYDFAVIEFSDMYPTCNLYPGDTVGSLNWWSGFVPDGNEVGYVYGYPGIGCPGSATCNKPQIWGIGSTGMDEDGDNIDHYADTTEGESGAGLYVIDGNRYVVGSHQYWYSHPLDEWNEARRLEGLFFNYLIDYTAAE